MSDSGGLPRDILGAFAKDLRTKKWFERLQDQAIVLLPDQIKVINAAVEDAQGLADDAFALAALVNARQIPDIELSTVFVPPQIDDAELLPVPVRQPDMVRGWGRYLDTVYTQASPFVVVEGATGDMPNNAGSTIKTYLPLGVADFYNGTVITPDIAGDYGIITIRFMGMCTKSNGYGVLSIDIGGAEGQIFPHMMIFPKGAGIWHPFDIPIPCFMLGTFKANGGAVKIDAQLGDISVATVSYQIVRISSP